MLSYKTKVLLKRADLRKQLLDLEKELNHPIELEGSFVARFFPERPFVPLIVPITLQHMLGESFSEAQISRTPEAQRKLLELVNSRYQALSAKGLYWSQIFGDSCANTTNTHLNVFHIVKFEDGGVDVWATQQLIDIKHVKSPEVTVPWRHVPFSDLKKGDMVRIKVVTETAHLSVEGLICLKMFTFFSISNLNGSVAIDKEQWDSFKGEVLR